MKLNINVWLAFKSLGLAVIYVALSVAIAGVCIAGALSICLAVIYGTCWIIGFHPLLAIGLAGIIWTIMWGVDIYEKQMFIAHQHDYKHFIIV